MIPSKVRINFSKSADNDEFPEMEEENVLPWQVFTKNMMGLDLPVDSVKNIIEANLNERLDFRPYMNDDPMVVSLTDSLNKCADVFRKMHLRHLCVVHPDEGHLIGIVTR